VHPRQSEISEICRLLCGAPEMRFRFCRSIPSTTSIGCIVGSGVRRNEIRKRTTMLRNNRFDSFGERLDGRHPSDAEEGRQNLRTSGRSQTGTMTLHTNAEDCGRPANGRMHLDPNTLEALLQPPRSDLICLAENSAVESVFRPEPEKNPEPNPGPTPIPSDEWESHDWKSWDSIIAGVHR
jgi:hypothetical protein